MLTREQIVTSRNTYLSENFTLFELINSGGHPEKVEYPSKEVIDNLRKFAVDILQPLRDQFGRIDINSGYRNETLNKAVGGVSNSVHKQYDRGIFLGVAADIDPKEATLEDVFNWAFENLPLLRTAIIYRKPTVTNSPFIHLDTRSSRTVRAKMEKVKAKGPNNYVNVE